MKSDVQPETGRPRPLPRRDLILLPLISLLTVILLVGAAEVGTRLFWPEQKADSCLIKHGALGYRATANCTSRIKAAEGPWIENHYNECGLLSPHSCRTPAPNALRLAAVGSSVSFTYLVPWGQSWQGLTAARLGHLCGRPIDYQNYAGLYNLNESAMRAPEVAASHPEAAVMFVGATDLYETPAGNFDLRLAAHEDKVTPAPVPPTGWDAVRAQLKFQRLKDDSRAAMMTEHFLFETGRTYLDLYLRNGDKADSLRAPLTPAWQARLAVLDRDLGYMADQLRAQNVPLLVIYVPHRAQADLISGLSGEGTDPLILDRAIAAIAQKHGARFMDVSPRFRGVRDVASYYYPVDGHMNAKGGTLLADVAEQGLLGGPAPMIAGCKAAGAN